MLAHPKSDPMCALTINGSDFAIGGVLRQLINRNWKPIVFLSKHSKRAPERIYSVLISELDSVELLRDPQLSKLANFVP